jgi:hypothetical protein
LQPSTPSKLAVYFSVGSCVAMASPHRKALVVSSVVQGPHYAKMSLFGSGSPGLGDVL